MKNFNNTEESESLSEVLAGNPYFYAAQNRDGNTFVLVRPKYHRFRVNKALEAHGNGAKVQPVHSIDDYLEWFAETDTESYPEDFEDARDLVRPVLQEHASPFSEVYERLRVYKAGNPITQVDFAYVIADTLFIYKLAVSKSHKRRKNHFLYRAAGFFRSKFRKDLSGIRCYVAYCLPGRPLELQEKTPPRAWNV